VLHQTIGFTGVDGGTCTKCGFATYKGSSGSSSCTPCQVNRTTTSTASISSSSCICAYGYGGTACQACSTGAYKDVLGSSQCSTCIDKNATTVTLASTSSDNCTCKAGYAPSPWGSTIPKSQNCTICRAGYWSAGYGQSSCQSCQQGRYGSLLGATTLSCEGICPINHYCPLATSLPKSCPINTTSLVGSSSLFQCQCLPGYYSSGTGGPCYKCDIGAYSNGGNATACLTCTAHSTTLSTGSISITNCSCIDPYQGPNGGPCDYCYQGDWLDIDGHTCHHCAAGRFGSLPTPINNASCSGICSSGYYCAEASISSTSEACPINATSPVGSTSINDCYCPLGYSGNAFNGESCEACPLGRYKSSNGNASCQGCVNGAITTSIASTSIHSCECDAGYYGNASSTTTVPWCSICPAGTWSIKGSSVCSLCSMGSFGSTSGSTSSSCTGICSIGYYCPAGSTNSTAMSCPLHQTTVLPGGAAVIAECFCQPGYSGPNGGQCQACVAGLYSTSGGNSACLPCLAGRFGSSIAAASPYCDGECPINHYCRAGTVVPKECKVNSIAPVNSTTSRSCTCAPGLFGPNSTNTACSTCPIGAYCLGGDTYSLCSNIAANLTTFIIGATSPELCACQPGYTGTNGLGPCIACVTGKYSSIGGNASCIDCQAGRYGNSTSLISSLCDATCPIDHYCPSGTIQPISCPLNTTTRTSSVIGTQSGSGGISIMDCRCKAGFTGSGGDTCDVCSVGRYKSIEGSSLCINCLSNTSSSPVASTSLGDCVCIAGHSGAAGGYCPACLPGSYSLGGDNACVSCPSGRYGSSRALTSSICDGECSSGYYCPAGSISSTEYACPYPNSMSPNGSSSANQCICNAGYTGVNGGYCSECPRRTWGPGGNIACQSCPVGATTINKASTSSDACQCPVGYELFTNYSSSTNITSCLKCAIGWYKPTIGNDACSSCPINTTTSVTSSTSISSCICMPGYTGTAGGPCSMTPNPTVTLNIADGQAIITGSSVIKFVATFSRSVVGFMPSSIIVSGTAGATSAIISNGVSGSSVYEISVTNMIQSGNVTVTLPSSVANDTNNRASLAAMSSSNVVQYDITPPMIMISRATGQSNITHVLPLVFIVTSNEEVTSLTSNDITITGDIDGVSTITVSDDGSDHVVSVNGLVTSSIISISIGSGKVTDLVGNGNTMSNTATITYDIAPPIATVTVATLSSSTNTMIVAGGPIRYVITFNEVVLLNPVMSFDSRVKLSGSAAIDGYSVLTFVDVTSINATVEVNNVLNGTLTLTLQSSAFMDMAGNKNTMTSSLVVVIVDTVAPTVTITRSLSSPISPTNANRVYFELWWSEPVIGLNSSEYNSTSFTWSGDGGVYIIGNTGANNITIEQMSLQYQLISLSGMVSPGNISIGVKSGAVHDFVGNPNVGVASLSSSVMIEYDNIAPIAATVWSPLNSQVSASPLLISYMLYETASVGSLTLTFRRQSTKVSLDSSSPHIFTLSSPLTSQGNHSFEFNVLQPLLTGTSILISLILGLP
jgi:hypothetical protein